MALTCISFMMYTMTSHNSISKVHLPFGHLLFTISDHPASVARPHHPYSSAIGCGHHWPNKDGTGQNGTSAVTGQH